ncbi:MAG: slipin family protein [Clostridia bacterium]|nr:slipin family protein [Clostridia bacterium]
MRKVIVHDDEIGIEIKKGKFSRILEGGVYYAWGDKEIIVKKNYSRIEFDNMDKNAFAKNKSVANKVYEKNIASDEVLIHFVDGIYHGWCIGAARNFYWKNAGDYTFKSINIRNIIVDESEVDRSVLEKMVSDYLRKVKVDEGMVALVFVDGKFYRKLEAGTYFYWNIDKDVTVKIFDTRVMNLTLTKQELVTLDKVTLRLNATVEYVFSDIVKYGTEVRDGLTVLYQKAQLALREAVSEVKLDDLLSDREQLTNRIFDSIKSSAEELFIDVKSAAVVDIILPGEIRDIMNTVLVAEKKAQASNIARREEVASTRTLLNTAKLMDENKTLYHLKELEYIEKICSGAGKLTIGGKNVIKQLTDMIAEEQ